MMIEVRVDDQYHTHFSSNRFAIVGSGPNFSPLIAPLMDPLEIEENCYYYTDFKYLGSTLIPNGQTKDEIATRIMVVRNAFLRLMKLLWIH